MEEFDGPYFTPDLVGPDGKLSRLHKGKAAKELARQQQFSANAAQAQATQLAATQAQLAHTASLENQALASQMAEDRAALTSVAPPTQVIDDRKKKKRGSKAQSIGFSSAFGLGGGRTRLG